MRKLFSIFAALTLSVGLWAANSVITFTSTKKLCAIPDAQDLEFLFRMCEEDSFCAPLENWKNQHPEFKDLTRESFSQLKPTVFNPNAFLDANDQVLTFTYNYDESTHAGTITVNGELVKIADEAFSGCTALTSITLPEGVTSIEYQAFFECTGLTSITLPEGVTSIGSYAFSGCALTSVILPESLSSIGTDGFDRCPLSSVTIPANVTFLGYCAFGENSSLADVYVAWTTTLPTLEDNATFSWSPIDKATLHVPVGSKALYQNADVWKGFGSIVELAPAPKVGDKFEDTTSGLWFEATAVGEANTVKVIRDNYSGTSYTVPDTVKYLDVDFAVTEIEEYAFATCSSLESVTIPASVATIGKDAFYDCSSLQSVTLSEGLLTIGEYAFKGCSALQTITIPAGVTTIGESAFEGCSSLESVTIPASVTTIEELAFAECAGLTSVTFLGNACQNAIGAWAFYEVGKDAPALLTLHGTWAKENQPDEDGNWYGGKFELSEVPTALPTLFGDGVKGNKFLDNGQVIIRKNNKTYNTLGQEVK